MYTVCLVRVLEGENTCAVLNCVVLDCAVLYWTVLFRTLGIGIVEINIQCTYVLGHRFTKQSSSITSCGFLQSSKEFCPLSWSTATLCMVPLTVLRAVHLSPVLVFIWPVVLFSSSILKLEGRQRNDEK